MVDENFIPIGTRLRKLREIKRLYQYDVAERLSIAQKNVCVIEKRDDMQLSTLKKYIEALGGDLRILVKINELGIDYDLADSIKS